MVTGRVHRMTELFGRLRPGADLEAARAELRGVHAAMVKAHPESYPKKGDFRIDAVQLRDQIAVAGQDGAARAPGRLRARLHHRVLERRQPDPGAVGAARRRAGDSRDARGERRRAASHAAGREPAAVRRRRDSRRPAGAADGGPARALRRALLRPRARADGRCQPAVGRRRARAGGGRPAGVRAAPAVRRGGRWTRRDERRRAHHVRHEPAAAALRRDADRRVVRAAGRRRHAADDAVRAAGRADDVPDAQRAGAARTGHVLRAHAGPGHRLLPGSDAAHLRAARRRAGGGGHAGAVAGGQQLRSRLPAHRRRPRARRCRRRSACAVPDGIARVLRRARRARCSPAATSTTAIGATASAS